MDIVTNIADISTGDANSSLLDLFSTSQKIDKKCINKAPYLCIPQNNDKAGYLAQGCCNDWLCPRCGEMRARHEYGRIVNGARELAKENQLWFITLTCKGDISAEAAENTYLQNTNGLLSSCRAQAKKTDTLWSYASVTERQKRKHPHSHYLTTFNPSDTIPMISTPIDGVDLAYEAYCASVARINAAIPEEMRFTPMRRDKVSLLDYHSEWLMLAAVKSGLGVQARISMVDSVEACSRYVAKYLFKQTIKDVWPKGWKRVRYSQNWPKLPEQHNKNAFVILTAWDWYLAADSGNLKTNSYTVYERSLRQGLRNVTWNCELSTM